MIFFHCYCLFDVLISLIPRPTNVSEALLQSSILDPSTSAPAVGTTTYNDQDIDYRGGGRNRYGWNDPPAFNTTPNRPAPSRTATGENEDVVQVCSITVYPCSLHTVRINSAMSL